jgi:hypothetical protein
LFQLEQPVYDNGHGMSKLAPLVKREPKEPIEVQHVPVTPIIPLKSESGYQNKFSDFNVNPRGWNSSADHYCKLGFLFFLNQNVFLAVFNNSSGLFCLLTSSIR